MAAVLHGSARTTPRVRAELQAAKTSSRALAAQYSLNPKTVLKWRKRSITADTPMGPKPRSTVLTVAEEAIIVEFRRRTLLPLDDVLGCLRDTIPKLTRSALHRCLARHGISRLPQDETTSSKRKPFKETKIGYVHIDSAQFRSAEGKTHMFLAIDRVSKFVYVEFHETAEMATGGAFMRNVIKAFPYQIHTVLTDNGVAFTKNASTKWDGMRHMFDRACDEHGIEHRLTKPYHPWTNGQAERMNRTVKDATVKAFHYETTQALCDHVLAFVATYNFAKHLKALRWRTPFQAICDAWKTDPASFKINPHHLTPGLYIHPAARGTAKAGKPHRDLAEQRRHRMVPVVLHTANIATACAARPPNGVGPGLRSHDLPLNARQQPLRLGQGQTQIGDIDEITGPSDLHDVRARLLALNPDLHQSQHPSHASTLDQRTNAKIPNWPPHPQSRDGPIAAHGVMLARHVAVSDPHWSSGTAGCCVIAAAVLPRQHGAPS